MDLKSFETLLRKSLPVGTVLPNPKSGTTTVVSYDEGRLCYRRGDSQFRVGLDDFHHAAHFFAGSRMTTSLLKRHAPSVFDLHHGGHGCHATVLFLALVEMCVSGPIHGRGVAGDPFGVDVRRKVTWGITRPQLCHFRDQFRGARAEALADAEAYERPLHALERFGRFLDTHAKNLWDATEALSDFAAISVLAAELPREWPQFHSRFRGLLHSTRMSRNDVMHVGSRARHLTSHAVEVCSILEDALQEHLHTVADYMVRDIVIVDEWHPVSEMRRRMLESSFTFVPVRPSTMYGQWRLVGDYHLAQWLGDRSGRRRLLAQPIGDAMAEGLGSDEAERVDAAATLDQVRDRLAHRPLLVTSDDRVVGILAAFDLL